MSIFDSTQDYENPMRWTEALQQLKTVYATLKGQNMWDAIEPPKAESAMAAMQKEIAELKRRGKHEKEEGSQAEGDSTKKNPIKSHPAPKEGEAHKKIIDGKECSYCSKCRRWTFGSKQHTTEEHRTAAEIKAAKANGKESDSANLASAGSDASQDQSNASTLAMTTGFLMSAVDHCKMCADF